MKSKMVKVFLSVLFSLPLMAYGQNTNPICGTQHLYEQAVKAHPSLQKAEKKANRIVEKQLSQAAQKAKKDDHEKVVIPVVVHVLHNNGPGKISEGKVQNALKRLNKDFQLTNSDTSIVRSIFKGRIADFKYEFRLANKNPDGQCTNGINYTQTPLTDGQLYLNNMPQFADDVPYWNPEEYLNIWVVRDIFDRGDGFVIAGQANFPWSDRGYDGIIIRADQVALDDRTLTHEVGHYVGLFHPFQDGCTGAGDRVGDTPPAADRDGILPCDFNLNTCGGQFPDMVENYMDYTECGVMFTEGQRTRAEQFLKEPFRGELVSDSNLAKVGVQVVDKPPKISELTADKDHFYSCEPVTYTFSIDQTCQQADFDFGNPTTIDWQFPGGNPQTSSGRNPAVTYNQPGTYEVSLTLSNESGTDKVVKSRFVRVLGDDQVLKPPFIEGFEEQELDSKGIISLQKKRGPEWKLTDTAAAFGEQSFFLDNFDAGDTEVSSFRLPRMDLSGLQNPELEFDIAFATKGQSPDDLLEIFFSTDCGQTWNKRKELFSFLAKTSENETEPFVPTEGEWKTEDLTLPADPNVLVRFDWNSSEGGNNAYIDNIRMNWTVGKADEPVRNNTIAIYPNPTSRVVHLRNEGRPIKGNLQVNNSTGRTIFRDPTFVLSGGSQKTFETSRLNIEKSGVYYLTFTGGEQTITRKIVVVR